jgi:hypothetical protein
VFPGLAFRETMSGGYWRLEAPTEVLAIAVTLEARAPDLTELVRERTFVVKGTIDAERLAARRPLEGTIAFRFVQHGRVHYRLAFQGDDGLRYGLGGQKEWSPLAPLDSLGVLASSLYDANDGEIARATLRFAEPAGVWNLVKSLRVLSAR